MKIAKKYLNFWFIINQFIVIVGKLIVTRKKNNKQKRKRKWDINLLLIIISGKSIGIFILNEKNKIKNLDLDSLMIDGKV